MPASNLRPRICKPEKGGCGRSFMGGPRAWFCPSCRLERQRESSRLSKQRERRGETRLLGSEDTCMVCGNPYTVCGAHQKYCPACAPQAVKSIDAAQGLDYYHSNKDSINPARNQNRRVKHPKQAMCCLCGKNFVKKARSEACPDCRPEYRRQRQKLADSKRSPRKNKNQTP